MLKTPKIYPYRCPASFGDRDVSRKWLIKRKEIYTLRLFQELFLVLFGMKGLVFRRGETCYLFRCYTAYVQVWHAFRFIPMDWRIYKNIKPERWQWRLTRFSLMAERSKSEWKRKQYSGASKSIWISRKSCQASLTFLHHPICLTRVGCSMDIFMKKSVLSNYCQKNWTA